MLVAHIWVVFWVAQGKANAGVPGLPSTSLPVKPELTDRGNQSLLLLHMDLDTLIHTRQTPLNTGLLPCGALPF
jgi:hypothetical protein